MYGRRKPDRPLVSRRRRRGWLNPWLVTGVAVALVAGVGGIAFARTGSSGIAIGPFATLEVQSLDGSGNNKAHPTTWGVAGKPYSRVAPAHYGDGKGSQVSGPNVRSVSDRVFNDETQNVFSERVVSAWGWAFGQFMDHNIGLAQGGTGAASNITFNANDPMEKFKNNLGAIPFTRDAAAPGLVDDGLPGAPGAHGGGGHLHPLVLLPDRLGPRQRAARLLQAALGQRRVDGQ